MISATLGRLLGPVMAIAILLTGYFLEKRVWARERLVASFADALPADQTLHAYALALARPAYAAHCARCHGAAFQGDPRRGVPDLRHGVWLYDFGRVSDIERTILYGIRSGHGRARNVTDMPAMGLSRRLTADEISDVASYVFSLSYPGGDAASIARGEAIYQGKGECFDCHGADASGNIDWGVPALTGATWLYGGTRASITTSIHDGRHGMCPAWIGVLDPATIRALAVLLHDVNTNGART
jgi:cytochrome c oxidase cbb3-type subunit 3